MFGNKEIGVDREPVTVRIKNHRGDISISTRNPFDLDLKKYSPPILECPVLINNFIKSLCESGRTNEEILDMVVREYALSIAGPPARIRQTGDSVELTYNDRYYNEEFCKAIRAGIKREATSVERYNDYVKFNTGVYNVGLKCALANFEAVKEAVMNPIKPDQIIHIQLDYSTMRNVH